MKTHILRRVYIPEFIQDLVVALFDEQRCLQDVECAARSFLFLYFFLNGGTDCRMDDGIGFFPGLLIRKDQRGKSLIVDLSVLRKDPVAEGFAQSFVAYASRLFQTLGQLISDTDIRAVLFFNIID